METQVQQLKLNVNNIKSYLIRSNKELKGLRVQKRDLFSRIEKKREFREEEKRIETPNLGIGAGFAKISSAVTSPVRSIFDQILDFFGLIALGIIVNKLPEIINTIDNFFNSDFIKGVSSILESIGTAFTNLGRFVGLIPEDKQNEYEKDLKDIDKKLDESTKDFDKFDDDAKQLENFLEPLTFNISKLINDLNKKNNEKPDEQSGGGMGGSNEPDSSSRLNTGPEPPSGTGGLTGGSIPKPKPPQQKLSTGGTVRGDAKTDPIKNKPIHQPKQTPELKRAKRSAQDGFTGFGLAVNNISEAIEKDEENVKSFAELAEKIRMLNVINSGITTTSASPGQVPGQPPGQSPGYNPTPGADPGLNIPIDPGNRIVGYVGSSGRSTGPHIHIETGDGFSGSGRSIPQSVLSNIIVGGKPLSKWTLGDGIGAGRDHRGFDYSGAGINGKPIQLKGGLKFINYDNKLDPGGYGNNIVIQDKDGNKYLIGHLSAGPEDPKDFERRRELARKKQDPVKSGITGILDALKTPESSTFSPNAFEGLKIAPPLPHRSSSVLNNSSGGNQSLFIYALQPVETYVPFVYPMPVPQETASSSPEPVKLPSIWRA